MKIWHMNLGAVDKINAMTEGGGAQTGKIWLNLGFLHASRVPEISFWKLVLVLENSDEVIINRWWREHLMYLLVKNWAELEFRTFRQKSLTMKILVRTLAGMCSFFLCHLPPPPPPPPHFTCCWLARYSIKKMRETKEH